MPINTHCAIKWSVDNPMEKMPEINDAEWHIVHKGRQVLGPGEADNESLIPIGFVAAKKSIPVNKQIFFSVAKIKIENLHVSDGLNEQTDVVETGEDGGATGILCCS